MAGNEKISKGILLSGGEITIDSRKTAEIIRQITGIVLDEDKYLELEGIVRSRMSATGLEFAAYLCSLESDHDEVIRVASEFTIQETSFYRNREHYAALKTHILPSIIRERRLTGKKRLDILSAGCATGEEPYTLAMVLMELIPDYREWDIRIIAGDICENALTYAREGVYSEYKMRNIDSFYVEKYFSRAEVRGGAVRYTIIPEVKEMVTFRHANLLAKPFTFLDLGLQDIILCENVIIYFDNESIEWLMDSFYNQLRMPGYLFLGYSETLGLVKHRFHVMWQDRAYYYFKSGDDVEYSPPVLPPDHPYELNDEKAVPVETLYARALEAFHSEDSVRFEELVDEFDEDSAVSGPHGDPYRFLLIAAEFYIDRAEYLKALRFCQQAIAAHAASLEAHLLAALAYIESGLPEQAGFELDTARYIDPHSFMMHWLRFRTGGDGAEEALEQAKNFFHEGGGFQDRIFPVNHNRRERIQVRLSGGVV